MINKIYPCMTLLMFLIKRQCIPFKFLVMKTKTLLFYIYFITIPFDIIEFLIETAHFFTNLTENPPNFDFPPMYFPLNYSHP